jgi:hypothetical protein
MLYTQTVTPATLELLRQLMSVPELDNFALVGGTNLSLRLGHRVSLDIDLFSNAQFDINALKEILNTRFPTAIKLDEMKQTIWYNINGVKTDIVLHEYKYLQPIEVIDGIRLLSIPDIIPMKLGAVSGRGAKKDFWDISELLNLYSIKEMLRLYQMKYQSDDIGFIIRSLVYFDDAEIQSDPISLKNISWPGVKKRIEHAVKDYIKNKTS